MPGAAPPGDGLALAESARVLGLARAQIEDSLGEADQAVDGLLAALGQLLEDLDAIPGGASDAGDGGAVAVLEPARLRRMRAEAGTVIEAIQFYDRLSQRLGHLRDVLGELAVLFSSPREAADPAAWEALHERVRELYANGADRRLFDALMGDGRGLESGAAGSGRLDLF